MIEEIEGVDPDILRAWLDARSISRGLPLSIEDRGSFRVDTGLFEEEMRFVFASAVPEITTVAQSIAVPWILIKLCGTAESLSALLPEGWRVRPPSWFMTKSDAMATTSANLPVGYVMKLKQDGDVFVAAVLTEDGSEAASGRAVRNGDIFIYDQILTDADHRRRGLASSLMMALQAAGRNCNEMQVLTATPEGRLLYEALGWQVMSEYCTGEIAC